MANGSPDRANLALSALAIAGISGSCISSKVTTPPRRSALVKIFLMMSVVWRPVYPVRLWSEPGLKGLGRRESSMGGWGAGENAIGI